MMARLDVRYRHVAREIDRHGNVRLYCRIEQGRRVRLRQAPGTDAFNAEYEAALKQLQGEGATQPAARPNRPRPGSFRAACIEYMASPAFVDQYDAETQKQRRRLFEAMWDEPLDRARPDVVMGDCPTPRVDERHVQMLRDRKAKFPHQADHRLKALRAFFAWAMEPANLRLSRNPAAAVKYLRQATDGHHTWTLGEMRAFLDHHGPGTKARLAFALAMFTGLRVSDLSRIGPQHVHDGWISLTIYKNRRRKKVQLDIPVSPMLATVIATSKVGHLTYLATEQGKPFSNKGMGNRFKKWCEDAGLPHCSAHGVRKGGASVAAEHGANEQALMATFGWTDPRQAAVYTRAANKKVLAEAGVRALSEGQNRNIIPHLFGAVEAGEGLSRKKARKNNAL